ncbi:MAG: oxidoreductase [Rhodospirillaceae bacterium]|jgi:ferredoxin-NADP reductase|nr:oxidoreductase [Rhodospirillaceae bacterium]
MSQIKLKVADIQQLTENIKSFELVSADSGHLPSWEAGSHIDIEIDGHMRRSYSLSNRPGDTERWVTAILREENGTGGSKFMHDNVSIGDELTIAEPPTNHFPLDEKADSHVLIGGGIGITPLLSMGYRLKDMGAECHLHYCTKSKEETAFYDEIVDVFGSAGVTFHHDGGDPSRGIKLDDVLGAQEDGQHLYLCGPGGLINAAREAASHWRDGTVHFELFASAKSEDEKAETTSGDQPFEVELKESGITFTVPADKSIIELLWANEVDVMYACEDGWCGNCKVGLISGKADHRDEFLDEADRENFIQVCVSRAMPGEKLVLDI